MQRMVWAVLIAFAAVLAAGPWAIRELRKLKFGQNVYELAPESHRQKQGTPTMGGLLFALVTLALLAVMFKVFAAPYYSLVEWFMETSVVETQPKDLFDEAAQTLTNTENDRTAQEEPEQETIPLSSIIYPSKGDRYGRITIAGTTVDAPVYYGDTNSILNRGVGTYVDSSGAGIPGESKTILMAGHNNTFFTDLQHAEVGATVTITTHYGVYTYEVTEMKVMDYQDETSYDFSRTDENLILYTCYPFDALGFTPNRYFVYAKYVSGPVLDKNS